MDKEQLLQALAYKLSTGELTEGEVTERLGLTHEPVLETGETHTKSFSVTKMLYVLGAAIVVIGIIVAVSQVWSDLGSLGRVFITLGLGVIVTGIGSMLLKTHPGESIGQVFQFIGGMLVPGGALVLLSEFTTSVYTPLPVAVTFLVITLFYLLLNLVHKNAVLSFFAIVNGTAFLYLAASTVIDSYLSGYAYEYDFFYEYLTMAIGISYLLLGYEFRGGYNQKLVSGLYFFGITGLLGAAFMQVFDSFLWELLYIPLVMGGLLLAVVLKSRGVLAMSTFFMIGYVAYLTEEYFADSLGWPLSLVMLGFVFIGLGYASVKINREYIAN